MAYPTINELLKGEGGLHIKKVLDGCKKMRNEHRFHRQGYTDKNKYRLEAGTSVFIEHIHPVLSQFFDPDMDKKDRKRNLEKFLKLYPEFLTVDRYGNGIKIK